MCVISSSVSMINCGSKNILSDRNCGSCWGQENEIKHISKLSYLLALMEMPDRLVHHIWLIEPLSHRPVVLCVPLWSAYSKHLRFNLDITFSHFVSFCLGSRQIQWTGKAIFSSDLY